MKDVLGGATATVAIGLLTAGPQFIAAVVVVILAGASTTMNSRRSNLVLGGAVGVVTGILGLVRPFTYIGDFDDSERLTHAISWLLVSAGAGVLGGLVGRWTRARMEIAKQSRRL